MAAGILRSAICGSTPPQEEAYVASELYYPHLSYTLSPHGQGWVRRVRNRGSAADEQAQILSLPPGTYLLTGDADKIGKVTVPVTIYPGRLTDLRLAETRALGE